MKFAVDEEELRALERALESAYGPARVERMTELAWHLRQRDSARALELIAGAGQRLLEVPDSQAPGALAVPPDLARALTARLALAACEIATLQCRLDDARAELDRARAHLMPTQDADAEGDAWLAEAALAKATGERARELIAHEQALRFFTGGRDAQREGIARGRALCEYLLSADAAQVQAAMNGLRDWPDGGPAGEFMRLSLEAFSLALREPARATALFAQCAPLALDMGLLQPYCILLVNAGNGCLELGDLEGAAAYLEAAASQARRTGWPMLIGICLTHVGGVLRRLGRLQDSEQMLNAALAALRSTPPGVKTAMACNDLALTLAELGRYLEAIEVMDEAIRVFREYRSYGNLALSLVKQVRALAQVRDGERALAIADEAGALIERHDFRSLAVDLGEALALVHRRCRLAPPPSITAPSAEIHFAEEALSRGSSVAGWKPTPALLATTAQAWAEADDMAQAYRYARQAHAAQQHDEAFKTMNPQAVLRLLACGQAQQAEPQPQAAPAAAVPAAPRRTLTAKEAEVLDLLTRSYTNKEIARIMGVSAETVKWHLKGLYGKLEAGSRRQAVMRARTLGMLAA
ncbi:LuxR family transcriptional regulator [Pelomonas sp. KK5]|uniref:LuxR family transcriptional regulator n=1 Tax=Pelomonas sp. KK5 TaxID=1855730 RepID=UPI00097BED20|nr:LuxR family transcriptional regulator [Pelomonas sp. KK5]